MADSANGPLADWIRGRLSHCADAGLRLHVPKKIDVSAIRRKTGLSQQMFSARIGVSTGTLRNWEQGRRTPDGPARVLLAMLARNPRLVEETLGRE